MFLSCVGGWRATRRQLLLFRRKRTRCRLTDLLFPTVGIVRKEQDCTNSLVRVIQRINNKNNLFAFGTMYYTVQRVWSLIKFLNTFQVARVMSIHELRFGCETKTRLKKMDRSNNNFCNHHSLCTDSIVCNEIYEAYTYISRCSMTNVSQKGPPLAQ